MDENTAKAALNTWVDIRKNKRGTKKEMYDGMAEAIKERLSTKGLKRGIYFLHRN
jgi:hypothetical protein